MKKQKAYFNWRCPHCEHRNKAMLDMQFEMPRYYTADWECDNCGKESKLEWHLTVNGWADRRKIPKLRIRKKERHDKKETEDTGTQKDKAYRNDHNSNKK